MIRHWAAAACVCAVLSACGSRDEAPAADAAPSSLAVTVQPARMRELPRTIAVSGPVTAWEEMQLGVELGGLRVTDLHVDVGERVRKGELLLELDARTVSSELAQARAAHAEAQSGLELAQANLRRGETLGKEQLISASALDELRAARTQAQARVATARAAVDAAQLRVDFTRLRAPDDGIISKRLVEPGQVVAAGSELLRLIRDGRLEWQAELASDEIARVSVGDPVTLDAPGGAVAEGRVRAVSPGVDATTRTGTVYADLPDPEGLQIGQFVPGRIATGAGQALTVPAAAVVERDGYPYVFTVGRDGVAKRLRVRTGTRAGEVIEILDGLKPGTPVAVRGVGFLGDGDRVRVVAESAATPAANPAPAAP
ncbi:efflux RND transporter periplasmic adaptor subunit [Cognatilysobacter bugurensis]|uniref:Secretion protein HlyD n=1 Tax=Cognatilysobacter bugurensis TaxID=543356 RepID=A0A918T273_9GAMM|nr:efflux RND transporter periplasmic adaptor subunit [Lysobacter bugurensis]GHA87492.1 secretion protein HlyD [Lysobacter bugurensis]